MPERNITEECPNITALNDQDLLVIALNELKLYALAAGVLPSEEKTHDWASYTMRVYTADDQILRCRVSVDKVDINRFEIGEATVSGGIELGYAGQLAPESLDETTKPLYWFSDFTINVRHGGMKGKPRFFEPKVP